MQSDQPAVLPAKVAGGCHRGNRYRRLQNPCGPDLRQPTNRSVAGAAMPSKRRERELNDRLWERVRTLLHATPPELTNGARAAIQLDVSSRILL